MGKSSNSLGCFFSVGEVESVDEDGVDDAAEVDEVGVEVLLPDDFRHFQPVVLVFDESLPIQKLVKKLRDPENDVKQNAGDGDDQIRSESLRVLVKVPQRHLSFTECHRYLTFTLRHVVGEVAYRVEHQDAQVDVNILSLLHFPRGLPIAP